MKLLIASSILAALVGAIGPLLSDAATMPEVTSTVGTVGQLGIGGYLLLQVARVIARMTSWLDSLDKHHAQELRHQQKIGRKLAELVAILRRAHGIPDAVVADLTPVPIDPDERSAGRRRGVEPG